MHDFHFFENFVEKALQFNLEIWFIENVSYSWHFVDMQKDQYLKMIEEEIQGRVSS